MPPLFGSTGSLLGKQLGSIASLSGFGEPQRWDEGLTNTMLAPDQPQIGGLTKLSGRDIGVGETDPLTGSFGGIAKIKGADIGQYRVGAGVSPQTGRSGSLWGGAGNVGGDWAGVERWANEINRAAQQFGIPPNLIKAVMKLESGGDPNAAGAAGVWGPMQVNSSPDAWGYGPWSTDPVANIMKGAEILKHYYDQYGNWRDALRGYHGFGSDGYTTDQQYADIVLNNWDALNSASGSAGMGFGGGTSAQAITAIFGPSAGVPDWGEFGAESGNGLYGYGRDYGLNGTQHTGVDVPLALGSPFAAPMGGTVVCSGTGIGQDAGGGGCGSFNDYYGQGAGRIEVLLDNGVTLIFGHSSQAMVRPGQRVNAGQVIGLSGGMNSPHIHLEARVRDGSMPSGWRIVDPRSVLGGSFVTPGGYGGGGGGTIGAYAVLQRMRGY